MHRRFQLQRKRRTRGKRERNRRVRGQSRLPPGFPNRRDAGQENLAATVQRRRAGTSATARPRSPPERPPATAAAPDSRSHRNAPAKSPPSPAGTRAARAPSMFLCPSATTCASPKNKTALDPRRAAGLLDERGACRDSTADRPDAAGPVFHQQRRFPGPPRRDQRGEKIQRFAERRNHFAGNVHPAAIRSISRKLTPAARSGCRKATSPPLRAMISSQRFSNIPEPA